MERKLASIQKIINIQPIPNADLIEVCTVLGWQCVIAKKDNFKINDLIIYIEIDSILPEKPEFEFLRTRKFRIKTIKLLKQISQGLVLPLSILPKGNYKEGDDVTNIIGVKKYDPQFEKEQELIQYKSSILNNKLDKFMKKFAWYRKFFITKSKIKFPQFIKKTDEDRIQLFPDICNQYKELEFEVTEKLDGQSATYFFLKNPKRFLFFGKKYIFGVCSRNLYLLKPDNSSYWTVAKQFNIKEFFNKYFKNYNLVVLQGEIIGDKIQGNKYKINGYDFYAFNLIIDDKRYGASYINLFNNIKAVPLIDKSFKLKNTIPEMVEYAKGNSVIAPIKREGIVIRNYNNNISFKVINPEFLLKYEEDI